MKPLFRRSGTRISRLSHLVLAFVALVAFGPTPPARAAIFWQNHQFVINNARPNWTGAVAQLPLGPNQSRNHVISFEIIQNDLAVLLNNVLHNQMSAASVAHLSAMTDALFPFNGAERAVMQQVRRQLLTALRTGNAAQAQTSAGNLLALLNSSSDNIRVGNSSLNQSIGMWLDADFMPGYLNQNLYVNAVNGQMHYSGYALRLAPAHETIVYRYQQVTTQTLSFVVNGLNGAFNGAAAQGMQLSSTALPTVAPPPGLPITPYPVLVFDPSGQNLPYLYR